MAKIILKREGKIVHRETKTFDRRAAANAWMKSREDELSQPGAIERAKVKHYTLADAIDRHVIESLKAIGKTKAQVLNKVKEFPIADMRCEDIRSTDILSLAQDLVKGVDPAKPDTMEARTPQTVGNYLSHLSSIFSIARPAWDYPLSEQAMQDAMKVARKLGIIGKSAKRDRRPTLDEIDRIMAFFHERSIRAPQSNPMEKIVAFAIFSTRRQEEITRIKWDDLDEDARRVLVRDMKHPGEKAGNDTWCDLPEPALEIIQSMPRIAPEIFPFSADAISAAFTRTCALLYIHNLRFHDLRHEGVSRLFEMGNDIPHVAAVSGHRSWHSLRRYTHMRQRGDKYDGWKWIKVATAPLTNPRFLTTPSGGRSATYERGDR